MVFEEFPKEALIGKVQFSCNLLDTLRRILQPHTNLHQDVVVYPLVGRFAADVLDCL